MSDLNYSKTEKGANTTFNQVRLKFVARFLYGDSLPKDNDHEGGFKVFGSNGVFSTHYQTNTLSPTIIIGRKGSYGRINWSDKACFASDTTFFVDNRSTKQNLRWLYYALQSLNLHVGTDETAVPGLSREDAYEKVLWLPPLEEQRAIAAMLDAETARLDELMAEKECLLQVLAEKRRALITRAVTRGLDAAAPLCHSGLQWLGEIPEHWKLVKLKYLAIVRTGVAKGRDLKNQQTISVPYLRVANVQDGYLNLGDVTEIEILPHELKAYSLQPGDVLMNEGGDIDKLGRGAVWNNEISPCLHQNHVFAVRCKKVWPVWLSLVTSASYAKAHFEAYAKRTTNLASISATNIQELLVVMPPDEEQSAIVEYIATETRKLDELHEVTKSTVGLLKERRAALIAAAVTGQITMPK